MDLFEDVHSLEQQHIRDGREEGRRDGEAAGLHEGRLLGLQKGFDIGAEVGYYAGCVRAWRQVEQRDASAVPERAARAIAAMEQLLAGFPLQDPQDEALHDCLEALRGKFKAAAAALGKSGSYLAAAGGAAGGGDGAGPEGALLAGSGGRGAAGAAGPPTVADLSF